MLILGACLACLQCEARSSMLGMLIVLHTAMPFTVTLSKDLVHYYYMPRPPKFSNRNGIPSYKFTIQALGTD